MPRKRWSEEQIIYAVKQAEAGEKAADICRELGVREVDPIPRTKNGRC